MLEFKHTETPDRHEIRAYDQAWNLIGYLGWDKYTQLVQWIWVSKPYRRNGIATTMWEMAQKYNPIPLHDFVRLSEYGNAWINGMERKASH